MSQIRLINKEVVKNSKSSQFETLITIAVPSDINDGSFDETFYVGKQVLQFVTERFRNRKIPALLS